MRGNTGEVAGNRESNHNCVSCLIDFEIPEEHSRACATWAFGNLSLLLRGELS